MFRYTSLVGNINLLTFTNTFLKTVSYDNLNDRFIPDLAVKANNLFVNAPNILKIYTYQWLKMTLAE